MAVFRLLWPLLTGLCLLMLNRAVAVEAAAGIPTLARGEVTVTVCCYLLQIGADFSAAFLQPIPWMIKATKRIILSFTQFIVKAFPMSGAHALV